MLSKKAREIFTKRMGDYWGEYKSLLPPTAGEVQVSETRMAFYGGMNVMFKVMEGMCFIDEEDEEAEKVVLEMLDNHKADLMAFLDEVLQKCKPVPGQIH